MELDYVSIGSRIRMVRKKKKLSQIAFALKLNVSREQLSRLENGCRIPSLDILCEVSKIGKVSLDYLITGKETECLAVNTLEEVHNELLKLENGIRYVIELITYTGLM